MDIETIVMKVNEHVHEIKYNFNNKEITKILTMLIINCEIHLNNCL